MCGSGLYCALCGGCQRCLERRRTKLNSQLGTSTRSNNVERNCPRCSTPYTHLEASEPECDDTKLISMLQNLPWSLKMTGFQENFGMMASPEWYEEDIAHGNF